MKTPILEELIKAWISLFAHSSKSLLAIPQPGGGVSSKLSTKCTMLLEMCLFSYITVNYSRRQKKVPLFNPYYGRPFKKKRAADG